MPRLPFQLSMPKGARTKVVTDQKPLTYDSTKVYMHMGTALKAS